MSVFVQCVTMPGSNNNRFYAVRDKVKQQRWMLLCSARRKPAATMTAVVQCMAEEGSNNDSYCSVSVGVGSNNDRYCAVRDGVFSDLYCAVFTRVRRQQKAFWPKQGCLLIDGRIVLK